MKRAPHDRFDVEVFIATSLVSLLSFSCSGTGFGGLGSQAKSKKNALASQIEQSSADFEQRDPQTFRQTFETIIYELNKPDNKTFDVIQAMPTELAIDDEPAVPLADSVDFFGYTIEKNDAWLPVIEAANQNIRENYATLGDYWARWGVNSVADLDFETSLQVTEYLVESWARGPEVPQTEETVEDSVIPGFELQGITPDGKIYSHHTYKEHSECTQAMASHHENASQCAEDGNKGTCDYSAAYKDGQIVDWNVWGYVPGGGGSCPPLSAGRSWNAKSACVEYLAQTQRQYTNACVACQEGIGSNCGDGTSAAQPNLGYQPTGVDAVKRD